MYPLNIYKIFNQQKQIIRIKNENWVSYKIMIKKMG